eukprot:TRINITY_DN8087_c0_g1_i18.p2 TRINITY_DN8087_c0_g1~~TRINITY_DN8087_c0_g1_i18.p2  ORF type:complete len:132 (+),score=16.74 TRINITY_DN8087_c0_g1_i18:95-490(+)
MIPIRRVAAMFKESIDSIETYLGSNSTFKEYTNNKMLRRAIEREFEIIGEAIKHVDRISCDIDISCKKQIIGMRNRVIHGYDKVDNDVVWGVIIRHLPVLKQEVQCLLDNSQSIENSTEENEDLEMGFQPL